MKSLVTEIKSLVASVLAQWLRLRLATQETLVRPLVLGDPTCRGALRPCTTAAEPVLWSPQAATQGACTPRACALQQEKPPRGEATPRSEGAPLTASRESPSAAAETQHSQSVST